MKKVRFKQVDVFTSTRFKGNPVAVVLQADGLTGEQMQQIANWTNLSETTFVIPKSTDEADYRVRIFTPGSELPFAGHPTIGTAHALIEAGLVTPHDGCLIQECGAGLVRLDITRSGAGEQLITFELPQPKITPLTEMAISELESTLGTRVSRDFAPCLVDVGPKWIVAQLPDAQAVLSNQPSFADMKVQNLQAKATGVVIFGKYPEDGGADVEVRAYAPACGVNEDPVCGSGNGAMAAFIRHTNQVGCYGNELAASQGQALGRSGSVFLTIRDDAIKVGGQAVTAIDGTISVD